MISAVDQRGGTEVVLGLGANVGDPPRQLRAALRKLGELVRLEHVSSLYLTSPVEIQDQPDFYNLVCTGRTEIEPDALLLGLHRIEREAGRERQVRYGPRALDIDLLAYGERAEETAGLTLPHPRMHERRFVLEPLAEIRPTWRHPRLRLTATELLARLPSLERVVSLGPVTDLDGAPFGKEDEGGAPPARG
jgi:2-amino-4-hydroxy-6-hydroxymethyldihydropteridine diphosphokinase